MFAFQWTEFSPPFSSAHRLFQCYHRQKRDRRRCNPRGIPPQPPATSERVGKPSWARSLEWRHVVVAHSGRENLHNRKFLFYCEGMLSLVVLWLCDCHWITKSHSPQNIKTDLISGRSTWPFGAEMVVRRGMTRVMKHSVLRPLHLSEGNRLLVNLALVTYVTFLSFFLTTATITVLLLAIKFAPIISSTSKNLNFEFIFFV